MVSHTCLSPIHVIDSRHLKFHQQKLGVFIWQPFLDNQQTKSAFAHHYNTTKGEPWITATPSNDSEQRPKPVSHSPEGTVSSDGLPSPAEPAEPAAPLPSVPVDSESGERPSFEKMLEDNEWV